MKVLKVWAIAILILAANLFATPFLLGNEGSPHKAASQPTVTPLAANTPKYVVSLDANSVSQTDVSVASSASQSKSFRIGAVINSTSANPLAGIYGWQFGIVYNASAFIPQGDPSSASYPDGAMGSALPGAQISAGSVNWAAKLAANNGILGSTICSGCQFTPPYRQLDVYFTLLNPAPTVTIAANTILANVNFELLSKPSTPQIFNITDVAFVSGKATPINGTIAGFPIFETITNAPPVAVFTVAPDPNVSPTAFIFNASASYDPDGTIPNPGGYFWDFGDGTQSLGTNGSIVVHDYGINASFTASLRVQDNLGATGSARDGSGNPIVNSQPSHTIRAVGPDESPTANITFSPSTPSVGQQVFFTGTASDPDGYIQDYSWSFGDGSTGSGPNPSHSYNNTGSYSVTLTVTDSLGLLASSSITIQIIFDDSPTAGIVYFPLNIVAGQQVFFSANATDPDGYIQNAYWNFGDSLYNYYGQNVYHTFGSPGNYTVTLTVNDSNGLSATATTIVNVHPKPPHDVSIFQVYASSNLVVSSQPVVINVGIQNNGLNNETVSVTAYYGSNVIGTLKNIFFQASSNNCYYCNSINVQITWDTTGVPPGNYTISATVFLATDPTPADNTMSDGKVQVLPAPILTDSPSSGPTGTTVVLTGSNFPTVPYRISTGYIQVTYDDQLIGFVNSNTGSFNFTFSIPLSQPGQHWIKALDEYSGSHARVAFQVTSTPPNGNLAVTLQVGTVYFPSDTAVIYAQVSLNGLLTNPSSLQLVLYKPNGSNQTLILQSMGVGLFKTSYLVPKTGSIGTYLLVAKAHTTAPMDASATASFEVKQSWLSQGGPAIAGGATTATLVGLVAFAWKKGYFKKKEDDPLSSI